MERTIEELRIENEQLTQQLSNINEKLKDLGALLVSGKEQNVKLTYAIRLFAETHLTREEKLAIAQEFDRAICAEQVERMCARDSAEICPTVVDVERDFL